MTFPLSPNPVGTGRPVDVEISSIFDVTSSNSNVRQMSNRRQNETLFVRPISTFFDVVIGLYID